MKWRVAWNLFFFNIYFIYLWLRLVLVVARAIFIVASFVAVGGLSSPAACGILVPPPEFEPVSRH